MATSVTLISTIALTLFPTLTITLILTLTQPLCRWQSWQNKLKWLLPQARVLAVVPEITIISLPMKGRGWKGWNWEHTAIVGGVGVVVVVVVGVGVVGGVWSCCCRRVVVKRLQQGINIYHPSTQSQSSRYPYQPIPIPINPYFNQPNTPLFQPTQLNSTRPYIL